jgi:hypothetical protein
LLVAVANHLLINRLPHRQKHKAIERRAMEATVVSVGKSVLSGALGYAKSALAEEVALQLGVQRDHAFIRDELEMMLAFLMAAHDERDEHKVVKTWVKQVRDVAYDVEDSLEDFAVRLGARLSHAARPASCGHAYEGASCQG